MAFTRPKAAQIDFDVTNISDPLIRLNSGETGSADKDVGIVIERGDDTNTAIIYDESANEFAVINTTETGSTSGNVTIASYADIRAGTFYGDGSGLTGVTSYADSDVASYLSSNTIATSNINVSGDVLPDADNTRSLGSASLQWQEVYIGPGSLYVNGKKVLEESAGTIVVSADADQSLTVKTTGTGVLTLQSATTVNVASTLQIQSGNSITDSAGTAVAFGDPLDMNSNKITELGTPSASTDAATKGYVDTTVGSYLPVTGGTISSNLTVSGNFTVNGTTTTINTSTLSVADNLIDLNSDVTSGTPSQDAGIRILRGDSNAVQLRWNETNDKWELTTDGASYANIAVTSDIPTAVSDLTNDSGYITGYTVTQSDVTTHQAALSITESQISDLGTYLTASDITGKLNLSGGTMSGAIAMGANAITGMADPSSAQDAATKAYVDSQVSSVPTGDITSVTASTGLTGGGTTGDVTLSIDSTVATLTGTQTLTNKTITSPTISNPTLTGTYTFTSDATSTPAMTLTANSINDGVGALRINGSQADIFLNPSTATHTTITFAVNDDQRLAFGMDNNSDFYITRRTSSTWYDDTFVLDRDTGLLSLGYGATVAGTLTYSTLNDGTTALTSTVAELNYVDGVTSNIQTQIDNISSSFTLAADSGTNDTFTTGQTLTIAGGTGIDTTVSDNNISVAIDSTVATLTGTQTLTNKTLTSPSVNTEAKMLAQAELEFYDSDSSNYVSFRGPATVATNITWTLPNTDGTNGQVLSTNGSGVLSFADASGGGATVSSDTSTNTNFLLYFASTTTGALTAVKQDSGLIYNPSTGLLTSAAFSGSGASLTALNGSNISTGTVAAARVATLNQNTTGTAGGLSSAVTVELTGDVTGSATFTSAGDTASIATTIAANSVELGTDTTGNYVATIATSAGLNGSSSSEGGAATISLDLSELTDMTDAMVGTDEFIVLDAGAERRKAANEIGLSIFSNDSGFTTNTGTVTSVAGTGTVNGLTLSGTVTSSGSLTLGGTLSITESQISDLGAYATLASPTLTGTPAAPTATAGTNTTQIATTAFVSTAVANIVDTAPAALDTLNELAAALGDDANFATTTATSLGEKLVKASNLSDLTNAATARTNLGLGTAATTASTDYATAAQGTTADAALPRTGGAMTGAITTNSTFDGRDVAADGTKLDGIEASADVTDATNVTAAGALMDSEVTNLAQVKAFDSSDYATAAQGTTADAALPKAGGTMSGAIAMGTSKITGMGDPTTAQDAATKAYVDTQVSAGGGGNAFTTISVATQSDVAADSSTDTLTLAASGLIGITTDASTDTVTIATPSTVALPFLLADGSTSNIDFFTSGKINSVMTNLYIPFTKLDGSAVTTMVVGGA